VCGLAIENATISTTQAISHRFGLEALLNAILSQFLRIINLWPGLQEKNHTPNILWYPFSDVWDRVYLWGGDTCQLS
jgi:hypothetical protein